MPRDQDKDAAKRRMVAIVLVAGGLLAIFAPVIAPSVRVEILLYLFSLAAFFWALVVTWQIWQNRDK